MIHKQISIVVVVLVLVLFVNVTSGLFCHVYNSYQTSFTSVNCDNGICIVSVSFPFYFLFFFYHFYFILQTTTWSDGRVEGWCTKNSCNYERSFYGSTSTIECCSDRDNCNENTNSATSSNSPSFLTLLLLFLLLPFST